MKAKYTGPHVNNWYGIDLTTDETYDLPEELAAKVKDHPHWKVSARKKSVKKSAK